jgi:hypothetical protein
MDAAQRGISMIAPPRINIWIITLVLAAAVIPGEPSRSRADQSIYSYFDDRGNLVATDRVEDIPERYRNRVKVTNSVAEAGAPRTGSTSRPAAFAEDLLVRLVEQVPADIIPGLTAYQSVVLVAGFLAMLLFFGAGTVTGSPFLRLLMPWAIGFLDLATIYVMFVSELGDKVAARAGSKSKGSLVHQLREKGQHLGEQKRQRLKQVDQLAGQE